MSNSRPGISADAVVDATLDVAAQNSDAVRRSRRLARQFIKFGIVGASGFLVNQIVFIISLKTTVWLWSVGSDGEFLKILGSQFHIRWYHVFSTIAFVVANLWNFYLNRRWTFRTAGKSHWFKELVPFMLVGIGGLIITLLVQTALLNPESPVALSTEIFDNSTGFRTREYWSNFIGVIFAIPVNFILNKLWTFRAVREHRAQAGVAEIPET